MRWGRRLGLIASIVLVALVSRAADDPDLGRMLQQRQVNLDQWIKSYEQPVGSDPAVNAAREIALKAAREFQASLQEARQANASRNRTASAELQARVRKQSTAWDQARQVMQMHESAASQRQQAAVLQAKLAEIPDELKAESEALLTLKGVAVERWSQAATALAANLSNESQMPPADLGKLIDDAQGAQRETDLQEERLRLHRERMRLAELGATPGQITALMKLDEWRLQTESRRLEILAKQAEIRQKRRQLMDQIQEKIRQKRDASGTAGTSEITSPESTGSL